VTASQARVTAISSVTMRLVSGVFDGDDPTVLVALSLDEVSELVLNAVDAGVAIGSGVFG
jgi:hypothetical protein